MIGCTNCDNLAIHADRHIDDSRCMMIGSQKLRQHAIPADSQLILPTVATVTTDDSSFEERISLMTGSEDVALIVPQAAIKRKRRPVGG